MSEQLSARVDSKTMAEIDQRRDGSRSAFVRQAVNDKLGNTDTKRYTQEPDVTLDLTGFEARFIANRLWENAEWDHHSDQMEADIKLMARKIHSKVAKTRSDEK